MKPNRYFAKILQHNQQWIVLRFKCWHSFFWAPIEQTSEAEFELEYSPSNCKGAIYATKEVLCQRLNQLE